MDESNPYAAPMADISAIPLPGDSWDGLWRDGKNLVMHKQATLPNVCVKSGVETNEPGILRNLIWHPPWINITIPLGLFVFVVLVLILTKRAKISIPLCRQKKSQRRTRMALWWFTGLASLAGVASCFYLIGSNSNNVSNGGVVGLLVFLVAIVASLLAGQDNSRILRPMKITDTYIWLRGVHESILDRLPPMPPM